MKISFSVNWRNGRTIGTETNWESNMIFSVKMTIMKIIMTQLRLLLSDII